MTILDLADACRPRLEHNEAKRIAFKAIHTLRACNWRIYQLESGEIQALWPLFENAVKGPELPGIEPDPAPQCFEFEHLRVRAISKGGEPWFVGRDICDILGIRNTSDAISRLDKDERSTIGNSASRNGGGQLLVISESGLFSLLLRCQGVTSEGSTPWRFRRWVTHEVLPSIRRTGEYKAPNSRPKAQPRPKLRISGVLIHELRMAVKEGVLRKEDPRRILGLEDQPKLEEPEERPASPEVAAPAFERIMQVATSGRSQLELPGGVP